jgi:hypothetical protein
MKPQLLSRRALVRYVSMLTKPNWVSLDDIAYKSLAKLSSRESGLNVVRSGSWDLDVLPINSWKKTEKYLSIKDRYINGARWRDTSLFGEFRMRFAVEGSVGNFKSMDEVEQFYIQTYDKIFAELKRGVIRLPGIFSPYVRPLLVHIDREGRLMWTTEGNHRFAMMHLVGLNKVPVYLFWKHIDSPKSIENWV